MRFAPPLLIAALSLSACGGAPELRAERAKNIAMNKAAFETAKTVSIGGKSFTVAHVKQRNQALVVPNGALPSYTAADIEAAAKAGTGCKGRFDAGVLAFIGGDIRSANLAELRKRISGRFEGWSTSLDC